MPCAHHPRRHQGDASRKPTGETPHFQGRGSVPSPVLYTLGTAGLSGSILVLGQLGLCHVHLSGHSAGSPWLPTSVTHLDSRHKAQQRQAGWWTHSTLLTWGTRWARSGWVSARSRSSLSRQSLLTFTCAEVVPALCHSVPPPPGPPLHPSTTNLLSVTESTGLLMLLPSLSSLWESVSTSTNRLGEITICVLPRPPPKHRSNSEGMFLMGAGGVYSWILS